MNQKPGDVKQKEVNIVDDDICEDEFDVSFEGVPNKEGI